jgi:fructose-bisphosphate aldolase class II
MPLSMNRELLSAAKKGRDAVGAFNISNLEILQADVFSGEAEKSPLVIAVSEGAMKYAGIPYIASMVRTASEQNFIPVSLHLDRGTDLEIIRSCTASWNLVSFLPNPRYSIRPSFQHSRGEDFKL